MTSRSEGFTFVELVVVLLIISLGAGLVITAVGRGWGGQAERRFALEYTGLLRQAEVRAMARGRVITVFISPTDRRVFLSEGKGGLRIPDGVRLEAEGLLADSRGRRYLVFYPDGGCSGGFFKIFGRGTLKARLKVDPLTGAVLALPPGSQG